jgi:superfamily I DNA and RNA helicase
MAHVTRAEFEELKNKRATDFAYFDTLIESNNEDIEKLKEQIKKQNDINLRINDNTVELVRRIDEMKAKIKEINLELNMLDSKVTKATVSAGGGKKRTRKNSRKN